MIDGKVIAALIFAGLMLGLYLYAKKRGREQEGDAVQAAEERPGRRPSLDETLDGIDWWPDVWGVGERTHIYDQEADAPLERPAYVGAGRGHAL